MVAVTDLRVAQATIRTAVEQRLGVAIAAISQQSDPVLIRDSVITLTQVAVRQYGYAAGQLAANWYNELRASEGIAGSFKAKPVVRDFDEQIDATVRRTVGTMFTETPNVAEFIESVTSKAGQYTVDGSRNTVRESSYRDSKSSGWQRVPHGPTCDFCLMLVGRGGVYKRSTAVFKSHGGCDCSAVPSWDLSAPEVPTIAYEASSSKSSTAAVRSWIEQNQAELVAIRDDYGL